ncbi:hypothetical protein JNW90_07535 [Micromonospora sp. STR1s_5]|nr:hypothetical protein [Micromonospora sp. STR1s_5]
MEEEASTRFPFINLEKALGRAHQLFLGDKSGKAMPVPVAFELWGYGPKSSGAFQTVAALKGYGLITDEGANADRRVRLTDAARRYFLDERDDVRAGMLAEFALRPALFRWLWVKESWNEGIPADTVARSHLKIDRGLNEQSARALLSIFKDNVRFAGLKGSVPPLVPIESEVDDAPPEVEAEPDKGPSMPEQQTMQAPAQPAPPPAFSPASKPIVFDMESVTVSARFDNVEDLQEFIAKLQKLEPLMPSKH